MELRHNYLVPLFLFLQILLKEPVEKLSPISLVF
jgi:hypothetical protein